MPVWGALIFSTNFTLFYYGAQLLPSGLLAVVFSLTSIFNLFLVFILFGQKPSLITFGAGILGFSGVALMFRPQILGAEINYDAALGLLLCTLGTLSLLLRQHAVGIQPAERHRRHPGDDLGACFTA